MFRPILIALGIIQPFKTRLSRQRPDCKRRKPFATTNSFNQQQRYSDNSFSKENYHMYGKAAYHCTDRQHVCSSIQDQFLHSQGTSIYHAAKESILRKWRKSWLLPCTRIHDRQSSPQLLCLSCFGGHVLPAPHFCTVKVIWILSTICLQKNQKFGQKRSWTLILASKFHSHRHAYFLPLSKKQRRRTQPS